MSKKSKRGGWKYEAYDTPESDRMYGYPPGTGRVEIWTSLGPPVIPVCRPDCDGCRCGGHNEVRDACRE